MGETKDTIISRLGHKFLAEAATAILPEKKTVITTSSTRLTYDYCILDTWGIWEPR